MNLEREREIRILSGPVEIRAADDGTKRIVGYAAKFNVWSENLGGFIERILPGAFDGVIKDDVRCLFNHDYNIVLGRTANGTLKLSLDEFGLRYEVTPPDTTQARDLITIMERGDVNQSSFAFTVDSEANGDEWEYDKDNDIYRRTIKKYARLWDVSPVTIPAYPQTESIVAKRRLDEIRQERERAEREMAQRKVAEERKRRLSLELDLM